MEEKQASEFGLPIAILMEENWTFIGAGIPFGVREDPVLGERFRVWLKRTRMQLELKRSAEEVEVIGERYLRGDVSANAELYRIGESLIAMASDIEHASSKAPLIK